MTDDLVATCRPCATSARAKPCSGLPLPSVGGSGLGVSGAAAEATGTEPRTALPSVISSPSTKDAGSAMGGTLLAVPSGALK